MRAKGKITRWNDDKGFGFITPKVGGRDLLVRLKDFENRTRRPRLGELVTYRLFVDKEGRPCATKATLAGDRLKQQSTVSSGAFSVTFAILFLGLVAAAVFATKLPGAVLALYLAISAMAFAAYAWDRSALRQDLWRVPDSVLHLLSLAGGWPGALLAQTQFRLRSQTPSFRPIFWATVLLHCGVFAWVLTPHGQDAVRSVLGSAT